MKEYAAGFYASTAWRNTRKAYLKSVGGLCELCLRSGIYNPAAIVHHIKWITPENITDPRVTLSWDNLMAVCREHHEKIHDHPRHKFDNKRDDSGRRYMVSADGSVAILENAPPLNF